MNVLSVDTSTELLIVELHTEDCRIHEILDFGLRHSETLLQTIRHTLAQCDLQPGGIDLFACTRGPGSFTGLRIGMATVKGLAAGTGKPYVTVPTLDCLAYGYEIFGGTVVPVIDAKKNRVYTALYENGARITDELDVSVDELERLLEKKKTVMFTGPHAGAMRPLCGTRQGYSIYELSSRGNPGALSALALQRFLKEGGSPSDASPLYIRKSEAEIQTDGR